MCMFLSNGARATQRYIYIFRLSQDFDHFLIFGTEKWASHVKNGHECELFQCQEAELVGLDVWWNSCLNKGMLLSHCVTNMQVTEPPRLESGCFQPLFHDPNFKMKQQKRLDPLILKSEPFLCKRTSPPDLKTQESIMAHPALIQHQWDATVTSRNAGQRDIRLNQGLNHMANDKSTYGTMLREHSSDWTQ